LGKAKDSCLGREEKDLLEADLIIALDRRDHQPMMAK